MSLPEPNDRIGRFLLGDKLGSGTFSVVKLATHVSTKQTVAVKILDREKIAALGTAERVEREIEHLRRCAAHPHVIRLFDVVETPSSVCLVCEWLRGGELHDYITGRKNRRLSTVEARFFFQQIASAVNFLHWKKIAHRDLKLENILLCGTGSEHKFVKIADFGLSRQIVDDEPMKTPCGSPYYASPEVVTGTPYHGAKADVWSCGVILFALLSGLFPFNEKRTSEMFNKIRKGEYTMPRHLGRQERDLIQGMIEVDASKRISMQHVCGHRYFKRQLPSYLSHDPQSMEGECHQTHVNAEVAAQVAQLFSDEADFRRNELVTLDLVHKIVEGGGCGNMGLSTDLLKDVFLSYHLCLERNLFRQHELEASRKKSILTSFSGWGKVGFLIIAAFALTFFMR